MPRGRPGIELDKVEFQNVVSDIEKKLSPANRSQLWKFVEASDWAMTRKPRPLSAQVAMLKADKLGLIITTPKGTKGKQKGCSPPTNAGKRKVHAFPLEMVEAVKKEYAPLGEKTVQNLLAGKLKAAIKAKCWDCSGRSKKEVSLCTNYICSLWPIRPWREKNASGSHSVDDSAGHANSDIDSGDDE